VAQHILFLTERYPPDAGGVATSSSRISRALAALGADVDVVSWTRSLEAGQVAHEDGNPSAYRIGRFREWDATMPHTLNLLDWLQTTRRYDAVWGHYLSLAGFLAAWFGRLNGIPSVVSIRGNDLDRDVFPPGDFARAQWTLSHAGCVAAVTLELARKAAAVSGRRDILHLPNVVDSQAFAPGPPSRELRAAVGIRDGEAVLGFAGELREKKGLPHLLRALTTVREQRPACLLLIGDVRPSEMPRLAQHLGPGALEEHRVLITGQLAMPAEVNRHLHLCDVYLQPSLWDGMPNALLEAMAAGCGCIASDAGGIPEIVTPGVDGIIVPRWQLHRLGDAVLEWLDAAEADRERIRCEARRRAIAAFHPDREARALQALLEQLPASASRANETNAPPERSQV
jgi:glycosyltransferase involved in cell wall biosynthesis